MVLKPLQPTGHRQSHYERPGRYACGRPEAPCAPGPDGRGRCLVDPPCRPRLSTRARLGRATLLASLAVAGAVAVALLGPWRLQAVSPGPLAVPHEAVEGPEPGAANCEACHVASAAGPARWAWTALVGAEPLADDPRCLSCHFEGDALASASLVHGVAPEVLARMTAAAEAAAGGEGPGLLLGPPRTDDGGRLACATCHRDHQGREHALATLPDASCQVCHARRFGGLGEGHPEFGPVPRAAAGIAFDHASHRGGDHFGDEPFECRRCHVPEREGRAMDLRSFEVACRGCHNQGRDDHHGDSIGAVGLLLLQLPEMELPEHVVWPMDAAWGDDVMPPLMRLLLLGDDAALEPLESLAEEAGGIPYDWLPEEDAPLEAFAAAVRRLVADLAASDPAALRERLARALELDPADPRVQRLSEQLAGARFAAAVWRERWLPGLDDGGEGAGAPAGDAPAWSEAEPASGWRIDPGTGEIAYTATGHADPVFQALIEALADEDSAPDAHGDLRTTERRQLRAELFAERGGPLRGACLRCHRTPGPRRTAEPWHALGRGEGATGLRRFDHRPHTAMLREPGDCSRCHVVQTGDREDPAVSRGFAPHRRELCASCHTADRAGDACLLCHDYHFHRP